MRPHILRIRGIWHCRTPGVIGEGYTPSAALAVWRRAFIEHMAELCVESLFVMGRG